ncbi:MAG: AAA family ATPase, partial [Pseudobutyrivibrio sp.]|nr:AAA family ATPase [Pseudobutyrivibrio sp.]
ESLYKYATTLNAKTPITFAAVKFPNQIKSATDNVGTFDTNNPNIKYSLSKQNINAREVKRVSTPETVQSEITSFINTIDFNGEYGKALKEFVDEYGLPAIQELVFSITDADTHAASWNEVERRLKLGFAELSSSEERAAVLHHELLHSKTTGLARLYERYKGVKHIEKPNDLAKLTTRNDALTPKVIKAFDTIVECKKQVKKYLKENPEILEALANADVKKNLNKSPLYAMVKETNPYVVREFISEIYTNPEFIKLLENIQYKGESVIKRFWNAIKSMFGFQGKSILDTARKNAETILRVKKNIDAAMETISEDITSFHTANLKADLIEYYKQVNTFSEREVKAKQAIVDKILSNIKYIADYEEGFSEAEAEMVAENRAYKALRDNGIDMDMVGKVEGYRRAGSSVVKPKVYWNSYKAYTRTKAKQARDYVYSLTDQEIISQLVNIQQDINEDVTTFTFEDGTTVRTPFAPNAQQASALNRIDKFADSNKSIMTLSGYAGTGKTSIMNIVAKKLSQRHWVMFCATTNKAAGVLKSKVGKEGFDAETVNRLFGIAVQIDSNQDKYDANKLERIKTESKLYGGEIVIIDEASML